MAVLSTKRRALRGVTTSEGATVSVVTRTVGRAGGALRTLSCSKGMRTRVEGGLDVLERLLVANSL